MEQILNLWYEMTQNKMITNKIIYHLSLSYKVTSRNMCFFEYVVGNINFPCMTAFL